MFYYSILGEFRLETEQAVMVIYGAGESSSYSAYKVIWFDILESNKRSFIRLLFEVQNEAFTYEKKIYSNMEAAISDFEADQFNVKSHIKSQTFNLSEEKDKIDFNKYLEGFSLEKPRMNVCMSELDQRTKEALKLLYLPTEPPSCRCIIS